jgi:NAD(P)-dependent dehydrogenase (short-subunit alcohol dehydrogenase family)
MRELVRQGVEQFGSIDFAAINQGVLGTAMPAHELTDAQWHVVLSVNLTGSWQAAKAVVPAMMAQGRGSIVFTSSVNGVRGASSISHYTASKHGVIGLMRALAIELGPYGVRSNAVCPTTVPTNMVSTSFEWFSPPGTVNPGLDDVAPKMKEFQLLDIPWVQPEDVSAAVLWLASDEARYVTGVVLPVDGGNLTIYGGAKGGMPEGPGYSR